MVLSVIAERVSVYEKPPPVSDWMESNIVFDDHDARPGPLTLDPWQREVVDAALSHRITTLMASSQVGKSMIELGLLAYCIVWNRKTMMAWPTAALRDGFMTEKFLPLLDHCASLKEVVELTREGKVHKDAIRLSNGGIVRTPSGGQKGGAEQLSASVCLLDETDKFEAKVYQSDVVSNFYQRGEAGYRNPALILAGTPQLAGSSLLEMYYDSSDKRRLLVPCVLCSEYTSLEWNQDEPMLLCCQACNGVLLDEYKDTMLAGAKWEKQQPWIENRAGFHINQFCSPVRRWSETLARYNAAMPRDFMTQVLGLPFPTVATTPLTEEELAELYNVPRFDEPEFAQIMVCDVQRRSGGELVYGLFGIHGSIYTPKVDFKWQRSIFKYSEETWADTFQRLKKEHRDCKPDLLLIDAGDGAGVQVKPQVDAVFRSETRRGVVRSVKGYSSSGYGDWGNDLPVKNGVKFRDGSDNLALLMVSSGAMKATAYDMLAAQDVRLSGNTGDYHGDVLRQLSSEELRSIPGPSGREKLQWKVRSGYRNEALDLLVYALDGAYYLGPQYSGRRPAKFTTGDVQRARGRNGN